jgi:SpoVK/Ycf46/Vps4 family AAA+-type ATPase
MQERHELGAEHIEEICRLTEGYSGADMANLCKEAAMGPIRYHRSWIRIRLNSALSLLSNPEPDPVAMKWTIFLQDQLQLIKIVFALPKNTCV